MVLRSGKYLVYAIMCLSLLSLAVTTAQAQSDTSADRVQRPKDLKVTAPSQDKGVVAPGSKDLAAFNTPTPVKVVFQKVTNKGHHLVVVWFEAKTKKANGTGEVSQVDKYVLPNGKGDVQALPDLMTLNKELTVEYGKDLLTLRVTARADNWTWSQNNTATDEFDLTRYTGKVTIPFKLVSAPKPGGKQDWLVPEFEVTGYMEITRPEKIREGGIDRQIKNTPAVQKPPPNMTPRKPGT